MDSKCTEISPECPADGSSLGYPPNMVVSIIFLMIFSTSLACHTIQGWKYMTWTFSIAMCLGSQTEVIGYIGRILMHGNPYRLSTFLVQTTCLTTGPAFYSAGLYLCLSRVVIVYGENISRLSPRTYSRIFICCDAICLSLQGAGGGVAAAATKDSTLSLGNKLMLAGLILQIIALAMFATASLEFAIRVRQLPSKKNHRYQNMRASVKFRGFLAAMALTFATIFIRSLYRVVELGSGWNNSLMREEVPFVILESCMISITAFCFVVFHPGFVFGKDFHTVRYEVISRQNSKDGLSLIPWEEHGP